MMHLRSPPLDPLEPVREAPPPTNIKPASGPSRTPSKPKGGSRIILWIDGKPIEYGAQDVYLKQATPACYLLRAMQEEQHQVQAGAKASPEDPSPKELGVFCIPLCHL